MTPRLSAERGRHLLMRVMLVLLDRTLPPPLSLLQRHGCERCSQRHPRLLFRLCGGGVRYECGSRCIIVCCLCCLSRLVYNKDNKQSIGFRGRTRSRAADMVRVAFQSTSSSTSPDCKTEQFSSFGIEQFKSFENLHLQPWPESGCGLSKCLDLARDG